MGSPRVTYDVDVCYRNDAVNSPRMASALRELGVTLRGAPADLPFLIDGRTLTMGNNFIFDVGPLGFDILGYVEPLGGFNAVAENATPYDLDGLTIRVIGLDDLIRIKRHVNRSKDRESLLQPLAIKRIRDETGGNDPRRLDA